MGSLSGSGFSTMRAVIWHRYFRSGLIAYASLVLASLALFGCSGTPDRVDLTDGVRVTIAVSDATRKRYERFELLEDGTFMWGGGQDAMRDETTWETQMTASGAQDLVAVMRTNGWIPGPPSRENDGNDGEGSSARRERITVSGRFDGARFKWVEYTDSSRIKAVLDAFGEVARRRDASRVDRLARPKTTR